VKTYLTAAHPYALHRWEHNCIRSSTAKLNTMTSGRADTYHAVTGGQRQKELAKW